MEANKTAAVEDVVEAHTMIRYPNRDRRMAEGHKTAAFDAADHSLQTD